MAYLQIRKIASAAKAMPVLQRVQWLAAP